jgi:hypothetical protein
LHSGPASTDSVQTKSCARNQQAKKIMVNDRLIPVGVKADSFGVFKRAHI